MLDALNWISAHLSPTSGFRCYPQGITQITEDFTRVVEVVLVQIIEAFFALGVGQHGDPTGGDGKGGWLYQRADGTRHW